MIVLSLKVASTLRRSLDGGKYPAGSRIVIDRLALRDGLLMAHIEEPVKRWIWEEETDLYRRGKEDHGMNASMAEHMSVLAVARLAANPPVLMSFEKREGNE